MYINIYTYIYIYTTQNLNLTVLPVMSNLTSIQKKFQHISNNDVISFHYVMMLFPM